VLAPRVKRRLRRNRLSEEANTIEWEDKRKVQLLRTEVERLKDELEVKCAELQSIRDMEDLAAQEKLGDSIATNVELTARVQELEQQVADLKAELQQTEVEPEGFEDVVSRDLLSLDKDDSRVITDGGLQEAQINDDIVGISTEFDTSFPSPPPTMPNTPYKHSPFINARVPASIPNPDSTTEALNNQLQSELGLRGEIGLANHTPKTAQPVVDRPRKEKALLESDFFGDRKRRQAHKLTSILVPL
jgi:polyhydroxyalkanoate synthesis regulator phasin